MLPLLLLFTKPARPGKVKTRLIGALTPEQAAELHLAFLGDICERLVPGSFELTISWAVEPAEVLPEGEPYPDLPGVRQADGDLGERLYQGLLAASRDATTVGAVGSDHPEITPALIEEAFRRLQIGADIVLGPATDGGYYLIALHRSVVLRELFKDISWSTESVLRETLDRCRDLDLKVEILPPGHDIDTPEDLAALASRLRHEPMACPRTRSLLKRWQLL